MDGVKVKLVLKINMIYLLPGISEIIDDEDDYDKKLLFGDICILSKN